MSASFPLPLQTSKQTVGSKHGQQPSNQTPYSSHSRFLEPSSYNEHRRGSYASTLSEMSDLEYMSTNEQGTGLLTGSVSDNSNINKLSSAGKASFRQRLRNFHYQNYGAFLVLLSQAFGTGMNVAARLLEHPGPHGPPMHPFQILFVRQSITSLLCTVYAMWTGSIPHFPLGPPDRKIRLLLVSRGLGGFVGVCGIYFSLLYLPLSESTVLTFLAPVMACYVCSFVLPGETFSRQQQMAAFVSLVGVVLIARPFGLLSSSPSTSSASLPNIDGGDLGLVNATVKVDSLSGYDEPAPTKMEHLLAIVMSIIGVMGGVCALTSIRVIGTRAHAFISVNYFSVCSVVVSLVALIVVPGVSFRLPGSIVEWALLFVVGSCGFIMQILLTRGLAYGGPAGSSSVSKELVPAETRQVNGKGADEDIELQSHSVEPSSSSSHNLFSSERSQLQRSKITTTTAAKKAPSGNRATSMMYCQMLFALAADKVVFGTTLGIWSWIGSGLILAGAVWVATAQDGIKSQGNRASGGIAVADGISTLQQEHQQLPQGVAATEEEEVGLLHEQSLSSLSSDVEAEDDDEMDQNGHTNAEEAVKYDDNGPSQKSGRVADASTSANTSVSTNLSRSSLLRT